MEENISRSNIESFKLSITKISKNRIDKYELVNIAKNLNIEISSAATFCIQKRMVLKELLSHVLRECQDRKYHGYFSGIQMLKMDENEENCCERELALKAWVHVMNRLVLCGRVTVSIND